MKRLAAAMVALYAIYTAVLVWVHPVLIYPFGPDAFDALGWTQHRVEPQGTTLAYADGTQDVAILFFMGNGGSLAYFTNALDAHTQAGRSIAALEYRGGAGIAGTPSETDLKADALVAFDWLAARHDGPIVVHGYSMGTALALFVATQRPVAGIVLDASFVKMCELMMRAAYVPACYLPFVQKWNSAALVPDLTAPVLVQHGTADQLVPLGDGARLVGLMRAAGLDVTFSVVEDATHNNIAGQPGYRISINQFIAGL